MTETSLITQVTDHFFLWWNISLVKPGENGQPTGNYIYQEILGPMLFYLNLLILQLHFCPGDSKHLSEVWLQRCWHFTAERSLKAYQLVFQDKMKSMTLIRLGHARHYLAGKVLDLTILGEVALLSTAEKWMQCTTIPLISTERWRRLTVMGQNISPW